MLCGSHPGESFILWLFTGNAAVYFFQTRKVHYRDYECEQRNTDENSRIGEKQAFTSQGCWKNPGHELLQFR